MLDTLSLGHIFSYSRHSDKLSRRVFHWKGSVMYPPESAIRPNNPVGVFMTRGRDSLQPGFDNARPIFRMNRIRPGARRSVKALTGTAPNRGVGRTDVIDSCIFRIAQPENAIDI